jgi:hypothetical protein
MGLGPALAAHRLVTAVGPGGVGKTRLALSVVTEVAGRYDDGAWYVDLVPVTDPAMAGPAIAAALGLGERQGRSSEDTVLLHRGRAEEAMRRLATAPEHFRAWFSAMWQPWYAALWAEAAVVAGHPEAASRVRRARRVARDNPVAVAIVARAGALAGGRDGLAPAAAVLAAAGCRYQWARTLVTIGGAERLRGEAELAAMGATVMAWPPG